MRIESKEKKRKGLHHHPLSKILIFSVFSILKMYLYLFNTQIVEIVTNIRDDHYWLYTEHVLKTQILILLMENTPWLGTMTRTDRRHQWKNPVLDIWWSLRSTVLTIVHKLSVFVNNVVNNLYVYVIMICWSVNKHQSINQKKILCHGTPWRFLIYIFHSCLTF